MKSIIPSFTMSERSIITPTNPRGWNNEIITDPFTYVAPWQAAIKDAGAVFLLRPFGMSRDGYVTHTRNCYGGAAGKTFPLGPENGIAGDMHEIIGQWCDDGVIVYLYCGGIGLPKQMSSPLTELVLAARYVQQFSGVPDHANVRWVLDNEGEKSADEITPTDYMVMALRAVGRTVLLEPRSRVSEESFASGFSDYCCLWNRQRAALADQSENPIGVSGMVMVGGNKPDPAEKLLQLDTPEKRIAEARWQLERPAITVALAVAGMKPDQWMQEVAQ